MSVFIFTSLNRLTIPSKWQIIPLNLSWLIHLHNFAQEIPFLIPAWPHLCCQASSWTLKAKFQQRFLTFLWQKERNFYLLSQQIPAHLLFCDFPLSASPVVHLCLSDSDDLEQLLAEASNLLAQETPIKKKNPTFIVLIFICIFKDLRVCLLGERWVVIPTQAWPFPPFCPSNHQHPLCWVPSDGSSPRIPTGLL